MSTDTPSHIGTQWLWTKSPADWLTRTASRLSTRWVWAKGCIYFRGIYGPCCAPATHTSTSQDTRPQGLQVAAHGKRAGWDKVRRCRAKVVHRTTQISQSQPPLTTKGSGDLGSISSHEDPTPIGDAGCPWEWPPTDVTSRDITLEGLPPPSPWSSIAQSVCEWAFSLLAIRCFETSRFESCFQQRKTTCLL